MGLLTMKQPYVVAPVEDRLEGRRGSQDLVGVFAGETVEDRVKRRRRESQRQYRRNQRETKA